jgi:hypothetical protein
MRVTFRLFAKNCVPHRLAIFLYAGWCLKKSRSAASASDSDLLPWMSCCDRFTTPMKPSLSGYTRPDRISSAFVPWSMRSIFVRTPIVLLPIGSTCRASLRASELTMSTFAGDTAKMILLGLAIYSEMRFRVCFSISDGWSPMGT